MADSTQSLAGNELLLRIERLTKHFPLVVANDDISLDIRTGEIHCLLGENGAGKSTLAEILYGTSQPDSGSIYLKGQPVVMASPREAIARGIGMVHQHFVLIPPLSVIENVVVGTKLSGLWLDLREPTRRLQALCDNYGIELELNAQITQLSVGQQQWVEILKALYSGVELLILDEPTAVLTPQEVDKLFAILGKMRGDGLSIIFITHKLKEVMAVSDRVTVLRKGKLVATVNTADTTREDLARMMVGRELLQPIGSKETVSGGPVLEITDLHAHDDQGHEVLHGISATLHGGEILGLAGVSGNGQAELFDVLVGMRRAAAGKILLLGRDITNRPADYVANCGVGSVPEDRILQGLVMDFPVEENLILGVHWHKPFSIRSFLNQAAVRAFAEGAIRNFDIATPSSRQMTKFLSGGNLQKVVLARELSRNPDCLIASQPTRGLDVGAIEYVHRRLLDERDRGAGILLISEDLDELFALATRIAVIFKGQIVGTLNAHEATVAQVGLLMAGVEAGA